MHYFKTDSKATQQFEDMNHEVYFFSGDNKDGDHSCTIGAVLQVHLLSQYHPFT